MNLPGLRARIANAVRNENAATAATPELRCRAAENSPGDLISSAGPSEPPLTTPAIDNLRQHYLFAALDDVQWRALTPHLHPRRLRAGKRLFAQGDRAENFFMLDNGTMKLFRLSPQGAEKIMRLVRAGQSFAESILFAEPPSFPVHAQAAIDSVLVAVEREAYLQLLRASFDTGRAVMAQMTQRIHAQWDEIEALSLQGSVQRVARYLLSQLAACETDDLKLMSPKAQIAAQLGLAPETFSRALRTLRQRGLIEVDGALISVRKPQGLRDSGRI
ncbi:MAG: Crp/Fnr family transcriptional regulator [Rhodanobacteraceae bacterium]